MKQKSDLLVYFEEKTKESRKKIYKDVSIFLIRGINRLFN